MAASAWDREAAPKAVASTPPRAPLASELLPWWSKLVHRMLIEEAAGAARAESEDRDESESHRIAPGTPRVRLRAAVDDGPGVSERRVSASAVRAR